MAVSGYARATRCPVLTWRRTVSGYAYYAMSGTDIAYGSIGLRTCYAMSGTEIAYAAPRLVMVEDSLVTWKGYPPTLLLRDVRY
eukprot:3377383-Rhodomonas_salina.1